MLVYPPCTARGSHYGPPLARSLPTTMRNLQRVAVGGDLYARLFLDGFVSFDAGYAAAKGLVRITVDGGAGADVVDEVFHLQHVAALRLGRGVEDLAADLDAGARQLAGGLRVKFEAGLLMLALRGAADGHLHPIL